jgi:hypothetical protein
MATRVLPFVFELSLHVYVSAISLFQQPIINDIIYLERIVSLLLIL